MNNIAHQIEEARLSVVAHINKLQSKNKCSRNKAVTLFLKKYERQELPSEIAVDVTAANKMRDNTVSKATLYRWCQTVDKKQSLKPKLSAQIKIPKAKSFSGIDGALFYYSQLWNICHRDHKGNLDWLVEAKHETLEQLDLHANSKRFLWRVTVGEILIAYSEYVSCKMSSITEDFSRKLGLEYYPSPFPINHRIMVDTYGMNLKQKMFDDDMHSITSAIKENVDYISKKDLDFIDAQRRKFEKIYNVNGGVLSDQNAKILFDNCSFQFDSTSEELIKKSLRNWVYEAQVIEIPITENGKSEYKDINYLCYYSRVNPMLELPMSKKKMKHLLKSGVDIKKHIELRGFNKVSQV